MKLINKIFLTLITSLLLAQPAHAMSMQRAKDLLSSVAAKITQSDFNKPAYKIGAACAAGLAAVGLGWYWYNSIQVAKRTYQVGDTQFVAPKGALATVYKNKDQTPYKYKKTYCLSLKGRKIEFEHPIDGAKPSNILKVIDPSYNKNPQVQIIAYTDDPNISILDALPEVIIGRKNGIFAAKSTLPVGRIDYIFTLGTEE